MNEQQQAGLERAIHRAGLSRQWQYHHYRSSKQHFIIQMPLGSMDRVEKGDVPYSMASQSTAMSAALFATKTAELSPTASLAQQTLVLYEKANSRWLRFTTVQLSDAQRAQEALSTYAFPGKRNLGYLFAFEACRERVLKSDTTPAMPNNARYVSVTELERLDIPSSTAWHITNANANYNLCSSYPSLLVVPANAHSSAILQGTAKFRSGHRFPALAWGNGTDAASIWRCAQPKVGLGGHRSTADETFLKALSETAHKFPNSKSSGSKLPPAYTRLLTGANDADSDVLRLPQSNLPILKIMDLRPRSAAMANRTQGYGYESNSNYVHAQLSFYNIANIHGVRDALAKLAAASMSPAENASALESAASTWNSLLRALWNAAWQCAAMVHFHRLPVLVHCSHGWDRTSQVSALAQLLLDGYYRTMDGFAVLVEKEFAGFGHPFHLRAGHGEVMDTDDATQRSPILLQFIDAVWQLLHQYPNMFQFNDRYLLALSDHIYSCRFGTFLCDNERERMAASIYERTESVWDYLDQHSAGLFVNPFYNKDFQVLLPPLPSLLRSMTLWTDYHLRYSPTAYLPPLLDTASIDSTLTSNEDLPEELASLHCQTDPMQAQMQTLLNKLKAQEAELVQLKRQLQEENNIGNDGEAKDDEEGARGA